MEEVRKLDVFKDNGALVGARVAQLSLGFVALILVCYTDSLFNDSITNFAVFVSVVSVLYSVVLYGFVIAAVDYIIPGCIFIAECVLCIFWLCSFISLASDYGGGKCPSGFGEITRKCRTGKASIVFAVLLFCLFVWTASMFGNNVFFPLVKKRSAAAVFQTSKSLKIRVHNVHGCDYTSTVEEEEYPHADLESAGKEYPAQEFDPSAEETKPYDDLDSDGNHHHAQGLEASKEYQKERIPPPSSA